MSEQFNHNLNPDDFWPDAEKMLNKHFRTKMIIRRAIYASLIIAFFSGVTVWTLHNKNKATEHSAQEQELSSNGQTSLVSGENTTSNSSLTENTSSSSTSKDEASTTPNTLSHTNLQSNENTSKQTDAQKSTATVNAVPAKNNSTVNNLNANSDNKSVITNTSNTKHKKHFKSATSISESETTTLSDASTDRKSVV